MAYGLGEKNLFQQFFHVGYLTDMVYIMLDHTVD